VTLALGTHTWTLASQTYEGSLIVGRYAGNNAGLTISNGMLASHDVVIAEQAGATGTLTVGASGVLSVTGDVYIGGTFIAPGGTGTLNLNASSTTSVSGTVKVFPAGTLKLAAGTFSAGAIDLAGGTINATSAATLAMPLNASAGGGLITTGSGIILNGAFSSADNVSLTKNGASTFTINGAQAHGLNTTLTVSAGTLAMNTNAGGAGGAAPNLAIVANSTTNFGATQNLRALTVGPAVTATLSPNGGKTIKTGSLSMNATAKLNLNDNDLTVDYIGGPSPIGSWTGTTYTGITGLIKSGRNGGSWNGNGIFTGSASGSLTSLGVAEASQAKNLSAGQTALFSGQTVDATGVLVMYTYGGDANLDGKINVDDYGKDRHQRQPRHARLVQRGFQLRRQDQRR
jgi:hypothetical protein